MKKTLILGRGPSIQKLKTLDLSDVQDIVLLNNHERTIQDEQMLEKIQDKNIYIMCNIGQTGFIPSVLENVNVKSCLTNRFTPDWDLWQKYKDMQKKNHEGGTLNNLGVLPCIAEDEPYLYAWRGPKGRNKKEMRTYNGILIEHMPDEAEEYLIPIYEDKFIGNCSFYATLYAILKLKAEHVVYCGLDFYNHKSIIKSWFINPPSYLSTPWWDLRLKYEGEHMKFVYDQYFPKQFPNKLFEFHTTEKFTPTSERLIVNVLEIY